ncbi:unnamed protein product [Adineta steineri]|uniref:Sperm-associated antigen 17 n=3 Tax=Adineta steineri TaxID=433720 RepID=A0A814MRP0_9BILA|nr:unnamed protein product [Adineta steineri]CAF3545787.1 unnamed protein product [Adineta steineri]
MPPKGTKSPRGKSPKNAKADAGIAWESILTTNSVNQDNWTTFVCFLTPDHAINQIYVDLIEKAMQHSVRRRFDIISKRDFIEAIKKVEKSGKTPAKSSTNPLVDSLNNSALASAYEHAKTILDAGGEIDDQLWAKLIKCRILDLKKEVQNRCTIKSSSAQAAAAPAKPEKGKGGNKSPKPAAKSKKQAAAAPAPATDTHIDKPIGVKTRDQITDETKYIDDEPKDGPNQYIYLSGFYSIGLLHALDDVGIRIDTITDVSCDSLEETKQLFDEMIRRDRQEQTLKADVLKEIPTPEQIAEQNQRNDQVLNQFWTELMPILNKAPDQSMLQDVIVTTLKVLRDNLPDSWINTDQRLKLAESLCDDIVENSFRLNIRRRQFKTFNEQMKVVPIPTIEDKNAKSISESKIYNEMTTIIPPESISVPLILHGILEQVEVKLANSNNTNTNVPNHQDDVGRYLREKLMSLSMEKEHKKEIENLVPKSPFTKTTGSGPTMVYYTDEIKQRLATLNRLAVVDPIKIERNSLMSHSRLINLPELTRKKPYDPDSKERQTRFNQLLQFCTDNELLPSDIDHILKQFIFECMTLNATTENSIEQETSRPSTAESEHEDEQLYFEKHLTNLNEKEKKQSSNIQPIIWDDPFELLRTNQETGRIGFSTHTHTSSPTSHSPKSSNPQSPNQLVYTVRFDVNNPENNLQNQMSHILPPIGDVHTDGTIQAVIQHHKRNLNDWNFAEHFEPEIFSQVIEQALFTHSHVDVYYNRRDQTHMMVLSLPIPAGKTTGYDNTSKKLFSDVGFRNFLDEISYEIVDWLRDEEAKYQADVLAQEVQTFIRELTPTPDAIKDAKGGKKGKGAAGKKTPPSRSRSASAASSDAEKTPNEDEQVIRDDYAHPTSLKVWKQKRDKELEEEALAKAKRAESATKKGKAKSPRASEKAGKTTTPNEKSSKDGKSKQQAAAPVEKPEDTKPSYEFNEPSERFIGYSLGNHLLSAQCSTSHLLLPDGCFIRTRIDSLKRGATCVSTSLYRNKSSYNVQLVNPHKLSNNTNTNSQSDSTEHHSNSSKHENSTSSFAEKRIAQYGVFTALLNSGMILSCSNYDTKPAKIETPPPPPPPAPVEHHAPPEPAVDDKKKDSHSTKGKKKGKTVEVEAPVVDTESITEEKPPPEPQYDPEPFQRLTISIPTGLVVTFYPETFNGVKPTQANQVHRLIVKQYYACQSKGFHTCEQTRLNAYEENSRIIDGEGHVMIFKRNGELIILQPDGGIFTKTIVHQNEPEIEIATESPQAAKKGGRSDSRGKKKVDLKQSTDVSTVSEEVKPHVFEWKCVTSDGQIFRQNSTNQEYEKIDHLRLILETNPKTSEQVIHREDKVVIVFRSDGSRVVSFADGTRITTYEAVENKNNTPSDRETGELNNSTSSFRKIPHVKVEALGYATVAFNCQTTDCRTVFSDGSSIDVFSNGTYSIYESDGEQFDINENGDILFDFQQSIYGKRVQELLSHIEPSKCIMSQNGDVIFDAVDYEQKQYCVEASGETYSKENDQQEISKDFPMEMHVPRFFIVHEDGSGTELLRFKDLYSYLRIMDLDPSTAVVREPLSSNPKVTGATVMRPFQDEIHRRWLTSFEDDSVIPASLRAHTSKPAITDSQDSSSFRQTDKNNQSSTFSNSFTNQQPILEMPKALDYRNFMEFPRLHDEIRFKLFNSLKNYVDFVTNRADHHTKLLPHDHRNRHEKEQANKIWKHARPQGTTKDDLALLYLKTVHPDRQKPTATAAPTKQSVIPLAQVFNLNHLHTQLHQEKKNKQLRRDMSKGIAMPYFQTEWGTAYTKQQQQQPEMISTRESRSAGYTKTTNGHENSLNSPPISPTNQQNRLSQIQKPQFTRSLSTEVADNKTLNSSGQSNLDSTYRPVKPFASPRNTVQYDAYGNKRANPVRIPNSLKGSRPHAEPHTRFLDMEEPVMVRPNNASIGAATLNNRPLRARRGCELFPDKLDFGVLKEGVTYGAEVNIKNVGIDACRFRVRQPPLGTGLRVVFQPGVLAAGISRPLTIELYAIIKQNYSQQQQQQQQSQGLYQLDQSIEIITETDIMHFPIRAKIASEEQFEIMFVNKDGTAGMNKSVRLLARKSSNINDWIANTNKDTTDAPHE